MSLSVRLFSLLVFLWAVSATQQALSKPPVVTKAVPDNGDVGVDPSLSELRITFDQPMSPGGFSIVGSGDKFPELLGEPRWIDATTLVAPVKLKANHGYWLSINSDRFQNFRNRAREAAVPYPISFRTGSGDRKAGQAQAEDAASSAPLTATQNKRAVNLLRAALLKNYSYRDRLGINWSRLLSKQRNALVEAKTAEEFAQIAAVLLAQAEDKHIWLKVAGKQIPTYVRPPTPNVNFETLQKAVPEWQLRNKTVASGKLVDDVAYLWIGSWGHDRAEDLQAALAFLKESKDARALVIDVRGNGGDDERLARELAGCFVDQPVLYAQHVTIDPEAPGGFSAPSQRTLQPNKQGIHFQGRVVVLTGPVVMSSCEAFLLMMKQAPQAVLVGAASQGSSGNPQPHDLQNGVTVFLPSWKAMMPTGEEFEGKGIAPDVVVAATADDFKSADPVLAAALQVLEKEGHSQ